MATAGDFKIAELAAAQGKFRSRAIAAEISRAISRFTSADVAQLTLGELHLKDYVARPAAVTNGLQEAQARFNHFLAHLGIAR